MTRLGPITSTAQAALPHLVAINSRRAPERLGDVACREIVRHVAELAGVSRRDLLEDGRHYAVSRPRSIAMLLCREIGGASYLDLARLFNRNHSTVMSNIRTIIEVMARQPELLAIYLDAKRRTQQ